MRFTGQYYDGGAPNAGSLRNLIRGNRWKVRNYMRRFVTKASGVDETRVTDRAGKIRLSATYPGVTVAGGPPPAPPEPVVSEPVITEGENE